MATAHVASPERGANSGRRRRRSGLLMVIGPNILGETEMKCLPGD